MNNFLRVLIIEDSERDADLILSTLERAGYATVGQRVENAAEMDEAIEKQHWDIVISDFRMPQFDAFAALRLLQQKIATSLSSLSPAISQKIPPYR